MASSSFLTTTAITVAVLLLTFTANTVPSSAKQHNHGFLRGQQQLTHLHFFWHDIVGGRDPTAVRVAQAASTNSSATGFGAVVMIDDPMTEGPDMSSKLVGRAQGFYTLASKEEAALLMAMNLVFTDGKYNGSSVTVLGRNPVFNKVREMPVVGGSGLFRLARGYAQLQTHTFDAKTGDAVVEYNVFVQHY